MIDSLRQRRAYLLVSSFVLALDLATKEIVKRTLTPYEPVTVVPGFFDLTYIQNPGGVFGLLRDLDPALRGALFTVVPVLAIVLIAVYSHRTPPSFRVTQTALALVLGGALGNLIDRFRTGYVVDFLDVHWRGHHWPAFNIADSAICIGVGLLIVESLFVQESARSTDVESGVESKTS